jgi:phosphonate transport system substrate-binding protein
MWSRWDDRLCHWSSLSLWTNNAPGCFGSQEQAVPERSTLAAVRMISYLTPGYPVALFVALAEYLGVEVDFETGRSGPDPVDDPFAAGIADIGWVCSTSLVELTTGRPPSVQEVGVAWVPDDPDAEDRPVYFSDVIVRTDSAAQSLDDLAGRRIGCSDLASLSGYHALRIELDRRGHVPANFASFVMTGAHAQSIEQVLAGEVDGAVIDSIVRTRRARLSDGVESFRVVERLGPWPTQPVVMRIDATPDEVGAVRDALLRANEDPLIIEHLRAAALTRLVLTDPQHCAEVRAVMAGLGQVNR